MVTLTAMDKLPVCPTDPTPVKLVTSAACSVETPRNALLKTPGIGMTAFPLTLVEPTVLAEATPDAFGAIRGVAVPIVDTEETPETAVEQPA